MKKITLIMISVFAFALPFAASAASVDDVTMQVMDHANAQADTATKNVDIPESATGHQADLPGAATEDQNEQNATENETQDSMDEQATDPETDQPGATGDMTDPTSTGDMTGDTSGGTSGGMTGGTK